jgi:hypothetical protein
MTSDPTSQTPPPNYDWDWTSDGKYSIYTLASTHTTDVATLLWKTLGAHSQPAFNAYVNKDNNWNAVVPSGIIIRFPAGH